MSKNKNKKGSLKVILGLVLAGLFGVVIGSSLTGTSTSSTANITGAKIQKDFCTPALNECQLREFKSTYDLSKWDAKVLCNVGNVLPGQSILQYTNQLTELDLNRHGKVSILPGMWTSVDLTNNTAKMKNALDYYGSKVENAVMKYDPIDGLLSLDIKARNIQQEPFPPLPQINGKLSFGGLPPLFGPLLGTPADNGPTIVTVDIIMTLR